MKNKIRVILGLIVIFSLLLSTVAFAADTEPQEAAVEYQDESGPVSASEEIIYGVLDGSGVPDKLYAVVVLTADKAGDTAYYGPYEEVTNLSDTVPLQCENGRMSGSIHAGRFYFQAELSRLELPWLVDISYSLDGAEISPQELSGASGKLEITIHTTQNEGINPIFWDAYLIQATVTLSTECCRNIVAEGATVANAGSDKSITFMALPGSEGSMTVSADVEDFSMSGISIAAVPYTMAGMLENVDELTDGLGQLTGAVSQLSDGAVALSAGAGELQAGAAAFGDGLAELSSNSAALVDGSGQILAALTMINDSLSALSGLTEGFDMSSLELIPDALNGLAAEMEASSAELSALPEKLNALLAEANAALGSISGDISQEELDALVAANPDSAALQTLIANYYASAALKAPLSELVGSISFSDADFQNSKALLDSSAISARALAQQVQALLDAGSGDSAADGISSLIGGFSTLASEYSLFHEGLVAYTGGVDALNENWPALYGGISALASGTDALAFGAVQLDEGTSAIPGEVDAMLADYTGVEFEPCSFLSERNRHVTAVQFVLSTAAIEPAVVESETPDTATEDAAGFLENLWGKLVDLF